MVVLGNPLNKADHGDAPTTGSLMADPVPAGSDVSSGTYVSGSDPKDDAYPNL